MTRRTGTRRRKDPQSEREAARYDNPIASRELIQRTLKDSAEPMSYEELATALEITGDDPREALRRRLIAMVRDGQLLLNRREGYVPVDSRNLVRGRVMAHPDGFGFLIPDEGGDDCFLGPREMRALMHGDRAVVHVTGIDRRGRREGSVAEILERANETLVGRVVSEGGVTILEPDHRRINQEILIPPEHVGGAGHGEIAVVAIVEHPTRRRQAIGRVIDVLGDRLQPGMETDIAIHSHGIPATWPDAVEAEMRAVADEIPERDKEGRLDLRDLPLVTIDGADSRDFDDAVYCEPRRSGWRLIVAIADVAHYVRPDTALDQEALRRGNSVYFPNRVVPMLPEKLSNGLCSLNPGVDRLCMVCDMHIDRHGRITRSHFANGVMRSHARLTYDEVAAVLVHREPAARERHAAVVSRLEHLHAVYRVLHQAREKRGAIDFDSVETRIIFGDDGRIANIEPVERNDAHRLIEECMVAANVATARYLRRQRMPALYRVHAGPDEERLADLRQFLAERGLKLGGRKRPDGRHYAQVLQQARGRPDYHLIQMVLLRSLKQAVYHPDCDGHFGLSLDEYAHFTSPIRRYPDLLVHRAIRHRLAGGKPRSYVYTHEHMVRYGEQCSMTERRADEATRDAEAVLKCQYMKQHVGEEFDGVITGVTSFGAFVELQGIYTEGLVHITSLPRDYYQFDPVSHCLTGERSGRVFSVGDPLRVRVVRVDVEERKMDFEPVGEDAREPAHKGQRDGRGRGSRKKRAATGRAGKKRSSRRR